ncbi:recombinase family protein [Vibrio splendidus]|uniref:Resolvase/invertase-type recombinase catalytic domain-containing protein n=1 Tax=Vibrio splendidus TaxID=29497 RepID=A0A2T5E8K9_VIBSP|nr:recombinase family protein [Vibrio splendidus]PTP15635.1 hypothetical protein CWO36_19700 [Vibrio splendidus]
MKIHPYCRVSTGKQTSGLSMTIQGDSHLLEQLSQEYNMPIGRAYNDAGISSYKGKNAREGELNLIIQHIQSGEIASGSIIVMRALDRLSRQTLTASESLYNTIVSSGVRILTTIDSHLYKKDCVMSSVLKTLAFKTANEESAKKSYLTNQYALHRINQFQRGERPTADTAYDIGVGRRPWYTKIENKVVMVDDKKFTLARGCIDMALAGKGVRKCKGFLEDNGVVLSWSSVAKFFRSEYLIGRLNVTLEGKKYTLDGYYKPVCTESEWFQIRGIKEQRTYAVGNRKRVSILGGIRRLYCQCGSSMCVVTSQGNSYYRCAATQRGERNCFPALQQKHVNKVVLETIQHHVFTAEEDNNELLALNTELEQKQKMFRKRQMLVFENPDLLTDLQPLLENEKADIQRLVDDIESIRVKPNDLTLESYKEWTELIRLYLSTENDDLLTDIKDAVQKIIKRISINENYLIKMELESGESLHAQIAKQRNQTKQRVLYWSPVRVVDNSTYDEIVSLEPLLAFKTTTQDNVDSHQVWSDDIDTAWLKQLEKPIDKKAEFFSLLQGNAYEWKRKAIIDAGATSTQWQMYKECNVSEYGFTKREVTLTTKHYTKQQKIVVYREWNESEILQVLGGLSVN